ncbi:MAG: D-alanyl-D-alanine carboxypeptidase [Fimbriimonadaceae bacterium]|nr:D-alanyl-D-alanine carboxypeptidase [Fimbriimonadaceae bacterium]
MISYFIPLAFQVATSLNTMLDTNPVLSGASFGVTIMKLDGTVVFNRDGNRRLIPASNQKLFSTMYGVHHLGLDFRPKTTVIECAEAVGVIAEGDPSMSTARLQEIGSSLLDRQKVVYVSQAYCPGVPNGWESDDLINRYAAPVTAFTVDQGAFRLYAENGEVVPLPKELGVSIERGTTTGSIHVSYNLSAQRVLVDGDLSGERQTIETLALLNPDRSAARFLGVGIIPGTLPSWYKPLKTTEYLGDPMAKLLADCLQPSDNNYAENFLLMTASHKGLIKNPSDPYPAATADEKKFFEDVVKVPQGDLRPVDGSGLARQNLVTTRAIGKALSWASKQPWFPAYQGALAAPGVGTLRQRLAGSSFKGKTGTLTSVVGLSGYVNSSLGEPLIVAIVINNSVDTPTKVRDSADQIIRWIETSPEFGPMLALKLGYGASSSLPPIFPNQGPLAPAFDWNTGPHRDRGPVLPWSDR